jgi:hypothetical protein
MGAPWEEHDGHGVVSDWTRRDKRSGEIVLCTDRGSKRYYDFAESMRIARRDGWGLCADGQATLVKSLVTRGRDAAKPLTQGEIAAEAVRRDFEYLRRWCADQWRWVDLVVELLDADGEPVAGRGDAANDSLWGMESDQDSYLQETAQDMALGLARGLQKEVAERLYWNARDVATV